MDDKDASAPKREDVIDPVSSVNDQTSSLGLHREGDVVLRVWFNRAHSPDASF